MSKKLSCFLLYKSFFTYKYLKNLYNFTDKFVHENYGKIKYINLIFGIGVGLMQKPSRFLRLGSNSKMLITLYL